MTHIIQSPGFDDPVDPESFIKRIQSHAERILDVGDMSDVIDEIKADLHQYQAIIIRVDNQSSWVTAPARIVIETTKVSFWKRVQHYMSYNRWPAASYTTPLLEFKRFPASPLNIGVHANDMATLDINGNIKYKLALEHIAITLKKFIDRNNDSDRKTIGVFKAPNGIWNANALRSWIELHEPGNAWSANADIDSMRVSDIVENVEFTSVI